MGVGVDGAEDAFVAGAFPPAPVHVEALRAAVEFDDGAGLGGAVDDHGVVDGVGFALEEQPAGDVA